MGSNDGCPPLRKSILSDSLVQVYDRCLPLDSELLANANCNLPNCSDFFSCGTIVQSTYSSESVCMENHRTLQVSTKLFIVSARNESSDHDETRLQFIEDFKERH